MKKFIKENWFKIGLIIVLLIVILIYLFLLKPIQEKKETLANNIKCQQEGTKLYEKNVEEEKAGGFLVPYYSNPEFKFNKELNTCLYKVEKSIIGSVINIDTNMIIDVYTNQKIFSWAQKYDNKQEKWVNTVSSQEEWTKKYNELFEIISI